MADAETEELLRELQHEKDRTERIGEYVDSLLQERRDNTVHCKVVQEEHGGLFDRFRRPKDDKWRR